MSDLSPDIDAVVVDQFRIECAEAHRLNPQVVKPAMILRRTRRAVCAELGVGEGAHRKDRAWASVIRDERIAETLAGDAGPESDEDGFALVTELAMDAMDAGVVTVFDAWLVEQLARSPPHLGAAAHRGRMGLTTPAVTEQVADLVRLSPRALRRRASIIVDRLAGYVRVRDDPELYPAWRPEHPPITGPAADEMQLVITDDSVEWVSARDVTRPGSADPASPARGCILGVVKRLTEAELKARIVEPTVPVAERIAVVRRAASRSSLKVALLSRSAKAPSRKTA